MGGLPASLSGDEMCRDCRFDEHREERRDRGGEAIEDDRCSTFGGAEAHPGEERELGATQARQRGQGFGDPFTARVARAVQALGNDLSLAFDDRRVGTGAEPDDLVGVQAQEPGGQRGGDGGVANPALRD